MADVSQFTDKELRSQLKSFGYGVGPITDATRSAYQQKLSAAMNGQPPAPSQRTKKASATSSQSSSREEEKASKAVVRKKKEDKEKLKSGTAKLAEEARKDIAKISLNGKGKDTKSDTTGRSNDGRQQPASTNTSAAGKSSKVLNTKAVKAVKPSGRKPISTRKRETSASDEELKSEQASDSDTMSERSVSGTEGSDVLEAEASSAPPSPVGRAAGKTRGLKAEKDSKPKGREASKVLKKQVSNSSDVSESGRQLLRQRKRKQPEDFQESSTESSGEQSDSVAYDETLTHSPNSNDGAGSSGNDRVPSPPPRVAVENKRKPKAKVAEEKLASKPSSTKEIEPAQEQKKGARARRGIREKSEAAEVYARSESTTSREVHSAASSRSSEDAVTKEVGRSRAGKKATVEDGVEGVKAKPVDDVGDAREDSANEQDEEPEDDISNKHESDADDSADNEQSDAFVTAFPGREQEFRDLHEFTRSALANAKGCAYVSGVPGTGKTATVHQVIAALKLERQRNRRKQQNTVIAAPGPKATAKERRLQRAESEKAAHNGNNYGGDDNMLPDFVYVEVNGMRMLDAKQLYVRLYQGLMKAQGLEVSDELAPGAAEKYIADLFGSNMLTLMPDGGDNTVIPIPPTMKTKKPAVSKSKLRLAAEYRKNILLVVDELDAFKTARQDILYKLFEYAQYPQNKFVVITIANTMDLDERHAMARVTSRLAMSKFQFQPYTHEQLTAICQHWLQNDLQTRQGHLAEVVDAPGAVDAFRLAARKVANLSGDARRVVQICKRALEMAEEEADGGDGDADEGGARLLTVHHVNAACEEMFKSPKFAYLHNGVTPVERLFVEAYLDVVGGVGGGGGRDYADLEAVYRQMMVRIRLAGGGGGGGDGRGTRSRTASAKQQQQQNKTEQPVVEERLMSFNAAQTAMKNLLTYGVLQESVGDGGKTVPGDGAGIQPRFFTLSMSTADAQRALEMKTGAD